MKRNLIAFLVFGLCIVGRAAEETVEGIMWTYQITDGTAEIVRCPAETSGEISVPSSLGECPVTSIGIEAFFGCDALTSVTIPEGVTTIGDVAFDMCSSLASVTIPTSMKSIGYAAFSSCGLMSVTIPEGVTNIAARAFIACRRLTSVTIPASVVSIGDDVFSRDESLRALRFCGCPPEVLGQVPGWCKLYYNAAYADEWRPFLESRGIEDGVAYTPGEPLDGPSGSSQTTTVLVTTNVVIHYVLNSVQPQFAAPPSGDLGFVNVITEVKGGAVAVPASWASNFPSFADRFGSDITKSLMKPTGKKDAAGNEMLVWQDYVSCTDPTNPDDRFTASITMVDGVPMIGYSPEPTAEQAALRIYRIFGKVKLGDAAWTDITDLPGPRKADYNFFKVTVEMK